MDEKLKKERFESLSIKTSVVKKFRRYCKIISQSQSMTLLLMLEFFKDNGLSPKESIGPHIQTLENLIKKRMNGMIAIMRDIEKTQTKPTTAMLELLFTQKLIDEEPEMIEKKFSNTTSEKKEIDITVPKIRYERLHFKLTSIKEDFEYVLKNVKAIKNNFGKSYFKLELTEEELIKFKRGLKV
jgi:hypothetical protein